MITTTSIFSFDYVLMKHVLFNSIFLKIHLEVNDLFNIMFKLFYKIKKLRFIWLDDILYI